MLALHVKVPMSFSRISNIPWITVRYSGSTISTRDVRLAKKLLQFGFAKKLRFSVRFWFYKTAVSFFRFDFCTVCCLMCMHSIVCFPVYCFITVFGKRKGEVKWPFKISRSFKFMYFGVSGKATRD